MLEITTFVTYTCSESFTALAVSVVLVVIALDLYQLLLLLSTAGFLTDTSCF